MLSCCVVSNSKETLVCYLAVNGQQHFRFLFNPPKLPVISVTFGGIWLEQNFYRPVDLSPNPNQQQWRSRSWLNHFFKKLLYSILWSPCWHLAAASPTPNWSRRWWWTSARHQTWSRQLLQPFIGGVVVSACVKTGGTHFVWWWTLLLT